MLAVAGMAVGNVLSNEQNKAFPDADGDGWDDNWVAKYPDADRTNLLSDANGDGVPNLVEMMHNRDPFAARQGARRQDPASPLRGKRRIAEANAENARMRQVLEPYMNYGLRDSEGNPITRAERRATKRQQLSSLTQRLRDEEAERKIRIADYLSEHGHEYSEYQQKALQDVVDGEPRFVTSLGHSQAVNLGVYHLWPGGITGNDLTGAGTAVAMWDFGAVETDHEQFTTGGSSLVNPDAPSQPTGRIFNVDSVGASEHATAVATVIAGAGDPGVATPGTGNPASDRDDARGMAYEGGIRVYDRFNDLVEMSELGEDMTDGTLDIVFSNHAYGTVCGWHRPYLDPETNLWQWHGDARLGESGPFLADQSEDWKFGFYLATRCRSIDEIVHTSEIHLPIWAAGNDSQNLSPGSSPEAKDHGPGTPKHPHRVIGGKTYTTSSAAPERDLEFLQNLIPEACSKNVLTVSDTTAAAFLGASAGSQGPTDDMRIKPDLCANSGGVGAEGGDPAGASLTSYRDYEGTSFSAAAVTGSLALVRQRWQQLNGTEQPVLASTWKALAIASAVSFDSNGPDRRRGYGVFNCGNAIDIVEADAVGRQSGGQEDSTARIIEVMLNPNRTAQFQVRRSGNSRLGVVICWTDPRKEMVIGKALNPTTKTLENDIDVSILDGGQIYHPWRAHYNGGTWDPRNDQKNDRDNVEFVQIPAGTSSEVTVRVKAPSALVGNEPQPVSIVIVDADAILPPFRITNIFVDDVNDEAFLLWESAPGGIYQIETSPDLAEWTKDPTEIIANGNVTATTVTTLGLGGRHYFRVRKVNH